VGSELWRRYLNDPLINEAAVPKSLILTFTGRRQKLVGGQFCCSNYHEEDSLKKPEVDPRYSVMSHILETKESLIAPVKLSSCETQDNAK
jgi:hypothetical protein